MRLLHLSFNAKLEDIWKPRSPYSQLPPDTPVTKLNYNDPIAEPTDPRISVSPTIEKCFQAIYTNIKHYFLEKKYPYMEMYVYAPEITKNTRILTPDELTKQRKVWDAFYTEEHWLLTPTKMRMVAKIRVLNTSSSGCIQIHPFNDSRYTTATDKHYICPAEVSFKMMDHYDKDVTLESIGEKMSNLSLEHKAEGNNQSGVVAFITSKDHPNKMFTLFHKWRDHMSIPSGTIDDGETPEETLHREMKEELGINVTSFKKLTVIKHRGMEPDGNLVDFTSHIFHVDGFNGVITNMELDSHSNLGYRGLEHIMFANPTDDITKYASTWLPKASSNDSLDLLSAFKEQFTQLSMASYTPTESKDYPGWYLSPGYEYFLANEEGAIRNAKTGRLLKGSTNDSGYVIVAAWDNDTKKKKDYKAHRVVCSAFKGPAPTKEHEVGHKNDKRDDNRPTNLHWTTRAKNMARVHIK